MKNIKLLKLSKLSKLSKLLLVTLSILSIFSFSAIAVYGNDIRVNPRDDIQAAIDKANRGDTVYLSAGVYHTDVAINIANKEGITISSQGGEVSIICSDVYEEVFFIENSTSINIIGIGAAHHIEEEAGCAASVINISNSSDISIEGCDLHGCGICGINIDNSSEITITECFIHHNSWAAISIYSSGDIYIQYNEITNNHQSFSLYEVNGSVEIMGNIVYDNYEGANLENN